MSPASCCTQVLRPSLIHEEAQLSQQVVNVLSLLLCRGRKAAAEFSPRALLVTLGRRTLGAQSQGLHNGIARRLRPSVTARSIYTCVLGLQVLIAVSRVLEAQVLGAQHAEVSFARGAAANRHKVAAIGPQVEVVQRQQTLAPKQGLAKPLLERLWSL